MSKRTLSSSGFGIRTVEDDERRASTALVWATGLTLLLAMLWAGFFELDEITRAQGKVIPSSREQVIQSLDAGVLSELLVREGSMVDKGQVLLRIDDTRSGAVYREAQEKYFALLSMAARLRAESIHSASPTFPPELNAASKLVVQETQAFHARRRALDESLKALDVSIAAVSRELALTEPLVQQGVMSEVELLRLRRQQSDLMGQRAERLNRYITDANNELVRVNSELLQTKENASAREDAFRRTTLRAPMKGVVKNVQVTTVGVIQAGQPILEIVPTEDEMMVEAYVKPADVAFLKVGQSAVVKLTAFDFNKYGGLDGVVEHLSPDTLRDERQRRPGTPVELEEGLYRILVRIKNANEVRHGLKLEPTPGMTAMVDIRTGQKTVLEYLFRPLQNVSMALRER